VTLVVELSESHVKLNNCVTKAAQACLTFDVCKDPVPVGPTPFCVAVSIPGGSADNKPMKVRQFLQLCFSYVCGIRGCISKLLQQHRLHNVQKSI